MLKGRNEISPDVYAEQEESLSIAADPVVQYMGKEQIEKMIKNTRKNMEKAAKDMNFMEAAKLRDEMFALQELLKEKFGN